MSLGDCAICFELIEEARLSITRHLRATSRFTSAMQKNADDAELAELHEESRRCDAERKLAMARYKEHVAEHSQKVMAAASGPMES